jgi:hypothetical protein
MKNQAWSRLAIATGIGMGMLLSLDLAGSVSPADAACRPTGRRIGGQAVLNCSGPTRCRPTGRFKVVRGVRYQVLRCPR